MLIPRYYFADDFRPFYAYFLSQPHSVRIFHKGDYLWPLGAPYEKIHYIISGVEMHYADHESGRRKIISFHGPGTVFPTTGRRMGWRDEGPAGRTRRTAAIRHGCPSLAWRGLGPGPKRTPEHHIDLRVSNDAQSGETSEIGMSYTRGKTVTDTGRHRTREHNERLPQKKVHSGGTWHEHLDTADRSEVLGTLHLPPQKKKKKNKKKCTREACGRKTGKRKERRFGTPRGKKKKK